MKKCNQVEHRTGKKRQQEKKQSLDKTGIRYSYMDKKAYSGDKRNRK